MAANTPYRPVITQGAEGGFNPKCNQASGAKVASPSLPSAADVAEEAMRKRAAQRADEEAYLRAKEASKESRQVEPKRWLSNEDLV
jgi:hypothetical protein